MELIARAERDTASVVKELAEKARGESAPVRLRIPTTIFDQQTKSYVAVPDMRWMMDLPDAAAVLALHASTDLYFKLMVQLGGPAEMLDYLQQCQAAIEQGQAARD